MVDARLVGAGNHRTDRRHRGVDHGAGLCDPACRNDGGATFGCEPRIVSRTLDQIGGLLLAMFD